MIKTTSIGVLILLSVSLIVSLGVNYFSPSGIALVGQWDRSKGVVTAKSKLDTVHADIEVNNPLVVKRMIQNGGVVLIDARLKDVYDKGHLPGALSFPLADFDQDLAKLLDLVKKDTSILVYCSGFECTDSHSFATQLLALKFTRVRVYAGGFREWQDMGFRIEKNEG
ncbi:MAG: rhodanese-like domain-containing protein [Desulfobacteraceae bacterium]|nr:rhodanese-like domain-containing protein [Desulfobacteraceae bacterium]